MSGVLKPDGWSRRKNCFPPDVFPPIKNIAEAIKRLPTPRANLEPQTVVIDAGETIGRYSVYFVLRQGKGGRAFARYWGLARSERVSGPPVGEEVV